MSAGAVSEPLLRVRNLQVCFQHRGVSVTALRGLSYQVAAGRTLAIVGESGSGKTASCRALVALLPSTAAVKGSICFDGRELLGLSERQLRRVRGAGIAMVFQDPARSLNPSMRVGAQIIEAIREHARLDRASARQIAIEWLRRLRFATPEQTLRAYPHQLSGGMQQRITIAVALAANPKLLIADEATRSLDVTTQATILGFLKSLQRQLGMAIIMVSHDLRMAAAFADEILVLHAGSAVEYGPAMQVFQRPRMPYTRALLAAIPELTRPPRACWWRPESETLES